MLQLVVLSQNEKGVLNRYRREIVTLATHDSTFASMACARTPVLGSLSRQHGEFIISGADVPSVVIVMLIYLASYYFFNNN